jgi:hypothetical protein
MRTRHRPEITDLKEALGLLLQGVEHVGQSDAVERIVGGANALAAAPGEGDRLVTDA